MSPQATKKSDLLEEGEKSGRQSSGSNAQTSGTSIGNKIESDTAPPLTHMIRNGRKVDQFGRYVTLRLFQAGGTYKITNGRTTVKITTDRAEAEASYNELISLKTGERKAGKKKKNARKNIVTVSGGLPSLGRGSR